MFNGEVPAYSITNRILIMSNEKTAIEAENTDAVISDRGLLGEVTLTRNLTISEQEHFLSTLFGFHFEDDVLIDDDGLEFYGHNNTGKWDFSTLSGIFSYSAHIAKRRGEWNKIFEIRKVLHIQL